ncbi:MAG: 16S rRNA (cytosine(1402)-N(4))-methyltransferase RsmH [Propionibacteriaceae bacterium]|nr:16S rRNA (cytosine(1402)-N(4))-methyltransferase RsmH [Propionibacteriaceae bacterium]
MQTTYDHVPVMCEEILDLLAPAVDCDDAILVDGTLGLGGHTQAFLTRFPSLRVVGIDRDPQAIALTRQRLAAFQDRLEIHQATYDMVGEVLGERRAQGILLDLGLSSLQIDSVDRGFAYSVDAPLSMRMDGDDTLLTAADVVNTYSVEEMVHIFRVYGDEKFAVRIAKAIVAEREREPFSTSARLVAVIAGAIPAGQSRSGHPAKRVFQAIRTEVNSERTSLEEALPAALDRLAVGGRMAVLSYHSGEDRLVKTIFASAGADHVPPGLAVVPDAYQAKFRLVTRGAHQPTPAERLSNPRSGSAKLRVIERVKDDA